MGTLNSVQERLDYLIKIKKMSENAFMKATGTNNIGKMRSGKLSISEGTISKICNSLGVSYLLFCGIQLFISGSQLCLLLIYLCFGVSKLGSGSI